MKPLSVWMILCLWVAGCAVGSLISVVLVTAGHTPLIFTPWVATLFVFLTVWLLAMGVGIRRLKRKEKTWVTPVVAGRTAIFARSTAPITAVFSGFLLGVAFVGLARSWVPLMAQSGWGALLSAFAAGAVSVVAVIVEKWSIDGSTQSDQDSPGNMGRAGL